MGAAEGGEEPEALVISRWFDPPENGEPGGATVVFTGHRNVPGGGSMKREVFSQEETIEPIPSGAGPVAITTWVYGLRPGDWSVDAALVTPDRARSRQASERPPGVHPAAWSWLRWRLTDASATTSRTRWALLAPLAATPAVLPGAYAVLATLAFIVAVATQASLAAASGLSTGGSLAISTFAIVAGLAGAKAWYAVLHPGEPVLRGGWAVDGFLVLAPLAAILALHVLDWPIGPFLDAATPGIFFGVAIGRVGCFLSGCCAGRVTSSRWGIWSSDRRLAARRIPTQLIEAGFGLLIGTASLWLVTRGILPGGLTFATAFVAYAVVRQALLRLRAERRLSPRTVPLTGATAGAMAAAALALSLTHVGG